MPSGTAEHPLSFQDTVEGLEHGDFSRLEPVFKGALQGERPRILQWYEEGRFAEEPVALLEALTCACFLGRVDVAEFLLKEGVTPAGGAGTGLNAFHWAANRGQKESVRLLLRWGAPLGARSMYDGNVLDTAVWSAAHEPKPDHLEIIEDLLKAGARLDGSEYPTGHEAVDAILKRYQAV